MTRTKIEWTQFNWNPIVGVNGGWGCNKVSAGCDNCYAEILHKRFGGKGDYQSTEHQFKIKEHILNAPLKRKKPTMYFVCSTMDLFHHKVTDLFICHLWEIILQTPRHTYQILTKRPERAKKLIYNSTDNVWLGVTTENQKMADKRIPILLRIPARVRFISIEPMLEKIDLDFNDKEPRSHDYGFDFRGELIDWVIFGCESGHNRRPCELDWVRDGVRQCKEAGVSCFIKQLNINGKVVRDINQFPEDLQVREYPR